MVNPRDTVLALKDLISLHLKDNPFPLENILIHINNELPIEDKFCATKELGTFADSIISGNPVHGVNDEKCIRAIQKMLDHFWFLIENKTYDSVEFPNIEGYYKKLNKEIKKVSIKEIEVHEDRQWAFIRDNYLNQAKEQIIFNFKPAEIGDDDDPRTRKLRRDLIRNLGLVTGTDYTSINDLSKNREVICNYLFVVPSSFKAEELWIGVLKELVRTIYELSKSIKEIEITRADIFDLSFKKLTELCIKPYKVNGKTFFDICNISVPDLNPLNVFTTSDVYCWAPTVVLTTSSNEKDHKGFIIFQDKDAGVAEMTEETIILWRETILKILSNESECKIHKFNPQQIIKRKTEVLQVIKSI